MAAKTEIICKCGCGQKKLVRTADVRRGWGRFYSKSCKARWQERRTGQCKEYFQRRRERHCDGGEFTGQFTEGGEMGHGA